MTPHRTNLLRAEIKAVLFYLIKLEIIEQNNALWAHRFLGARMTFRLGVDIGGTFTDLVVLNELTGEISNTKALTTPHNLTEAILSCIDQAGVNLSNVSLVIHGTTVGVNALVEHKGVKTGLLTTRGFRDVLEIGRGNSQRMFDILYKRPQLLVPRRLRIEISERLSATGEILIALDERAVVEACRSLKDEAVEAVAIVFLFSYVSAAHEERAAEIVRRELPGVAVTMSHMISQEWREYERTSTSVVNAYIQPIMERYLSAFAQTLAARGLGGDLIVMESNGGACSVEAALIRPVHTLESGPAAGVVGCGALGSYLLRDKLISFDMGGTTAKCCIVDGGKAQISDQYFVDGQPLRIPVIDITEVSAGGGSIGWVDAGGALASGPKSAGSVPGPVCYGLGGTQPTVTDANLVVGRINPDAFLGGSMPLRRDLAVDAVTGLAAAIGMPPFAAAMGLIRLAEVKMALAVRSITTERGLDPREYTLVAYGGCGPLHAIAVARELSIGCVCIPVSPATFSAWGMLAADLRHDVVRTVLRPMDEAEVDWASDRYGEMAAEIAKTMPRGSVPILSKAVDLRYAGQMHTVKAEFEDMRAWASLIGRFHSSHNQAYGYAIPDAKVELLNLRLTATVPLDKPKISKIGPSEGAIEPSSRRTIYSSRISGPIDTPVFRRGELAAGDRVEGPAAIEEATTTTYIDVGDVLCVDENGFLVVTIDTSAKAAA